MNLEAICKEFNLDFKKVSKELEKIMKDKGITEVAAWNQWKKNNSAELAVRKRGKELLGIYLTVEYADADLSTYIDESFYRIYFAMVPTEEQPAEIAYLKLDEDLVSKVFPEDPKPFQVWKFPTAYVTHGDRSTWIVASREEGVPVVEQFEDYSPTNEQIHEILKEAAKPVDSFYQDSILEDSTQFNCLFYLQCTGKDLRSLRDGREVMFYEFADLTDETSFVTLTMGDWDGDIEPIEVYEHVLVIGGYTKQAPQFANRLELRKSDKVPRKIIHCPTIS